MMKKILFVFNHPAPYKVRLLNELSKECDLSVIFERMSNSDRNAQFYSEKKYLFKLVTIRGLKIGKENFFSSGIKNHIKKNHYDLVIMNGYSTIAEMKAIKYLKKHHLPYCLYINGGIIRKKEGRLHEQLKNKYISGADLYMSPDSNSNKYLIYYGADVNKIHNYPYSTIYDREILSTLPSEEEIKKARADKGIDAKQVFVSCGQLIRRKNYLELIKNWPTGEGRLLLIIGDGEQKVELENYIEKNKISDVKLLGYMRREDAFSYYKLCDGFIFPSNEDIYGHVVNEAMSQGLPVISTPNVNSSKKLIQEGVNGFIIKDIKKKDLIEALNKIHHCHREKALETAHNNTIEKMVENHKKILL